MKIHQLLSGVDITLTNEETKFIKTHEDNVSINSLDDHNQWVAQNLVRKGVYAMGKDHTTLYKKLHEKS
jgi:hypothetical protein